VLIIEDRAIVTSVLVAFYQVNLHKPSEPVLLARGALQFQDRSPQSRPVASLKCVYECPRIYNRRALS